MGKPYSLDLRERIFGYVARGHSARAAEAYRDHAARIRAVASAERLSRDYGVASIVLDGEALGRAEQNLLRPLTRVVHWTQTWSCTDPGALVTAYADLFSARGGQVLIGDAMTPQRSGAVWSVVAGSRSKRIEARDAVIALGPWSVALGRQSGFRMPMFRKRGAPMRSH